MVGYGTFITHLKFEDKLNVETCRINNYIRIFPIGNWFPYVLPLKKSYFWALKFDVDANQLKQLDNYESVPEGLYERKSAEVNLSDGRTINAFIYVPTTNTIRLKNLTPDMDTIDRWKDEIRKFPELVKKFPELIL